MNADALNSAISDLIQVTHEKEFDYKMLAVILSSIANEIRNCTTQEELNNFVMELDHTLDGGFWR